MEHRFSLELHPLISCDEGRNAGVTSVVAVDIDLAEYRLTDRALAQLHLSCDVRANDRSLSQLWAC